MGTFVEDIITTDKLGRRTGPRTQHSIEEKLRIVEETRAKGASVAMVARLSRDNQDGKRDNQDGKFFEGVVFEPFGSDLTL